MSRVRNALALSVPLLSAGCRQDMHDQPRYEPLEESRFFSDGRASREPPEGTVARGQLHEDAAFFSGRQGDALVATIPIPLSMELVQRGQERYDIFCSPCHARTGEGDGMIVLRGYRRPPALHIERLRQAPAGHFFDVMTNGFGAMPAYRHQIAARDRWAIVAYVRALQLSRSATLAEVPEAERARLDAAGAADPAPGGGP